MRTLRKADDMAQSMGKELGSRKILLRKMSEIKMKSLVAIALAFTAFVMNAHAECVDDATLKKVNEKELQYMLNRVPPAFSHAVEDAQITYQHTVADAQTSDVTLTVTFPESHLQEAHSALDADLSKKILLAAQGYSLPEKNNVSATYSLNFKTLSANPQETLQSGALGKLRASVEMMYSLITQKRLNAVTEKPITTWSTQALEKAMNGCQTPDKTKSLCDCKVQFYAKSIAPRDYENLLYSQSNPYAFASTNNAYLSQLAETSEKNCGALRSN